MHDAFLLASFVTTKHLLSTKYLLTTKYLLSTEYPLTACRALYAHVPAHPRAKELGLIELATLIQLCGGAEAS